jgi:ABC-type sugar transport system substrate-binding protein
MVGRLAVDLFDLAGLREGDEVAIFTCNRLTKIFEENTNGFIEENQNSKFNLIGIIENYENPDIASRNTELLIKKYHNVKGIYVNSINSVAVCEKLVEMGYQKKIKLITVDLLSDIAENIRSKVINATIFQDPVKLSEIAIRTMYEYIAEQKEVASNIFVSPKIVVSSNISDYM